MSWSVCLKEPNGRVSQHLDYGNHSWERADTIDSWIKARIASIASPSTSTSSLGDGGWRGFLAYNDEPPGMEPHSSGGHCKGVVLWNKSRVGWLIHSMPCWPASFDGVTISDVHIKETIFAQSCIWLSLRRDQLPAVLSQIALMQPHVYLSKGADDLWKPLKRAPPAAGRFKTLNVAPGVTHVAKHPKWGRDLYEDGLCLQFGGSCIAETWLRPACAPTDHVVDVHHLRFPGNDTVFHESQDHSKWCVSTADSPKWTFVGDINRMTSQKHRGGGGVVLADPTLWKCMSELVVDTGHCPPTPAAAIASASAASASTT